MLEDARQAIIQGELVVVPTDTVYGIAANPFSESSVKKLLAAKGRGESMPPPVLVSDMDMARTLADVPETVGRYWPGALTVIVKSAVTLGWDRETVALRVPNEPLVLALLRRTGPLAVTSANLTGQPPARTVAQARSYFGDSVAVYLDGGPSPLGEASTIIDVSGETPRLVRLGAIGWEELEGALS